jgi:hypothetical protein
VPPTDIFSGTVNLDWDSGDTKFFIDVYDNDFNGGSVDTEVEFDNPDGSSANDQTGLSLFSGTFEDFFSAGDPVGVYFEGTLEAEGSGPGTQVFQGFDDVLNFTAGQFDSEVFSFSLGDPFVALGTAIVNGGGTTPGVPEIGIPAAGLPIALLLGSLLVASDRRRSQRQPD